MDSDIDPDLYHQSMKEQHHNCKSRSEIISLSESKSTINQINLADCAFNNIIGGIIKLPSFS